MLKSGMIVVVTSGKRCVGEWKLMVNAMFTADSSELKMEELLTNISF